MMEQPLNYKWKPIIGYEERYMIHPNGWIFSHKQKKYLKPVANKNTGIVNVVLYDGYGVKSFGVGKLVATYFLSNPNNYRRVAHKDGDKSNCEVSNLFWVPNNYGLKKGESK